MDSSIIPKSQALYVLIYKIFKVYFHDLFEQWSLGAPLWPKNRHSYAPLQQLLARWVVDTWAKVHKDLLRKLWEVCSYHSMEELEKEVVAAALVEYSQQYLESFVKRIAGQDGIDA